ncbi:uncharacterized protein LOC127764880 [Oryza glaberrima]|uniref:uncharacterized protein LOC127764880 n=1 Tax=Oryza glaberrima TaxID=4538 RepID=UPI00224C5B9D|nr:uncharacterized protein LOC127764880 [Oryza glaberrima]
MDSIKQCHGPPKLFIRDKYDIRGEEACLKRYTDSSFNTGFACSRMLEPITQRVTGSPWLCAPFCRRIRKFLVPTICIGVQSYDPLMVHLCWFGSTTCHGLLIVSWRLLGPSFSAFSFDSFKWIDKFFTLPPSPFVQQFFEKAKESRGLTLLTKLLHRPCKGRRVPTSSLLLPIAADLD